MRYADAGVNIDEAGRAVAHIKKLARRTFDRRVLAGIGAFGAMYALDRLPARRPVLVSSADGVGTKLKIAFAAGVHHTVGQDLVNHCVNDIAVQGAAPLFFLDYLAVGKLNAEVVRDIVRGLAAACCENGCALIGGETAEMPGFYPAGEYDLAGFIVGLADRARLLDGRGIQPGDALVGLPSTGLHTNGYSLARKLLFEVAGYGLHTYVPEIRAKVGDELLRVHRSYLRPLQKLMAKKLVRGAAHITGGGITENTPRMLPPGLAAAVRLGSWPVPPIFGLLQRLGRVPQDEMLRTFNLGLGMILAVPRRALRRALAELESAGETPCVVGEVVRGRREVIYSGASPPAGARRSGAASRPAQPGRR